MAVDDETGRNFPKSVDVKLSPTDRDVQAAIRDAGSDFVANVIRRLDYERGRLRKEIEKAKPV